MLAQASNPSRDTRRSRPAWVTGVCLKITTKTLAVCLSPLRSENLARCSREGKEVEEIGRIEHRIASKEAA